jgi:hypothetical protein
MQKGYKKEGNKTVLIKYNSQCNKRCTEAVLALEHMY